MEFKTIHGDIKRVKNVKKKIIDWGAPSKSKRQREVKKFLKKYWQNHVVFEEFPVAGTRLSIDFYNANKKIAVEVQGSQHTKYNSFFHGGHKNNYLEQLKRDEMKFKFCELNEIQLIEIYDGDIINLSLFKKFDVSL
ncbi:MAG: hypothetical protein H8E12_20575 [Rhodobacteraceae bacterium]|nr:hypothetical protein [Paracoccaceae bacterium]